MLCWLRDRAKTLYNLGFARQTEGGVSSYLVYRHAAGSVRVVFARVVGRDLRGHADRGVGSVRSQHRGNKN